MKTSEAKALKSMSFDELTSHIQELFNEAHALKRQAALVIVKAGEALSIAREKLPEGLTWVKFQAELGLPRATVNEAIRLHKAAKQAGLSDKELANLGVMDVKYRLGIRLRGGKADTKAGRRQVVIPRPSKKNVVKVLNTSMQLLRESIEFIEREEVDIDVTSLPDFEKLLSRIERLRGLAVGAKS